VASVQDDEMSDKETAKVNRVEADIAQIYYNMGALSAMMI
jgi:hypothetical protein